MMADIIPLPLTTTIVGRVTLAAPLLNVLELTDATERGYLIGYMDAHNGLPTAISTIREYRDLLQRIKPAPKAG